MKVILGSLAAAVVSIVLSAQPVGAQTSQAPATQSPAQQEHVHPAPDTATKDTAAATHDMHAMHSMMASMQASNAKLQGLLEKMNAATGPQKTEAMAALVTEMVQSQRAVNEAMAAHMSQCSMMDMGNMKSMPNMPKPQSKP